MKKLILIAAMIVFTLAASAESKFCITPHIGLGYSNVTNLKSIPDGNGFIGGVDVEYKLGEKWGLSGGLDYLFVKSEEHSHDDINWNYYMLSYLNIPVLAQYHMGRFAVKAGLQPAFNLSAKYHEGASGTSSFKDALKTFSLALPVGVSYDFNSPITLDLRCAIPLTKQNKYGSENVKLTTVLLTIGYHF